jgi:hypothetical protein
MFYRQAQAVVKRLHPEQQFEKEDLESLAKHVTDYSLAAMEGMKSRI